MVTKTIVISNKLGLHARASAKFVGKASEFSSKVEVKKGSKIVNGKSIMGIMMLAASKGTELDLITNGDDEQAAIDALVELIDNKFGEE